METNVVASSGNDKSPVNFPARDSSVIAVGGYDVRNEFWDEQLWADPWDHPPGHPAAGCPSYYAFPLECGSNFGWEQDFVAPSRRVLSTLPYGENYSGNPSDDYCNDANFGLPDDGIGYCTGTSMAAPQVSGVAALVRSVNPLLDRVNTYNALKETASNWWVLDYYLGWGAPNASLALDRTLGKIAGNVVLNRATPMFSLKIDEDEGVSNPRTKDRLYTTRPQVVVGALSGWYLAYAMRCQAGTAACDPADQEYEKRRQYQSAPSTEAATIAGYSVYPAFLAPAKIQHVPASAFWVMTSDVSLWAGVSLKPLHRLSFREQCDWRDHMYTTESLGISTLTSTDFCTESGVQSYQYDGLEGYILDSCPAGMSCNGSNSTEPMGLYRRYSYVENQYALILETQLSSPVFSTYTSDPWAPPGGVGLLGYVFANVDTDGDSLPDGVERMHGLNHLSTDSDCDGKGDGLEFPIARLQSIGDDPIDGVCK